MSVENKYTAKEVMTLARFRTMNERKLEEVINHQISYEEYCKIEPKDGYAIDKARDLILTWKTQTTKGGK